MSRFEAALRRILPYVCGAWVIVIFASLKWRFLDPFLATTWHGRIGFDFFSIPRAFINLVHGQSIYATRACSYGPYATWFPYHPAAAVYAGSWLSVFPPWAAFYVFAVFSVLVLLFCARLLGRLSGNALNRSFICFLLIFPLPVYLMIWNGQLHVLLLAAFCLVFYDLLSPEDGAALRPALMAGILLSLFSKPLVLLALPALLAVPSRRKTVLWSAAAYAAVSLAFILIPALNPRAAGFARIWDVLAHPAHMFRREIYRGVQIVSYRPEMLADNAIHWLNMRFRDGIGQPGHFELMSLSSFCGDIAGRRLPGWILKIPAAAALAVSLKLFFAPQSRRAGAAVFAVMAAALSFFLSYDGVYEYHYAVALVPLAVMLILHEKETDAVSARLMRWFCGCGALLLVPTSYFWLRNPAFGFHRPALAGLNDIYISVFTSSHIYDWALVMIRWSRVLPALVMFSLAVALAWRHSR
ncbi:MAG: hypothetical protein WC421_08105 [Elusimicrobiales bacterium]